MMSHSENMPLASVVEAAKTAPAREARFVRIATIAAYTLLAVTLAITTSRAISKSSLEFVGEQAFVSADVSTTARTFVSEGIWNLRGVPVNNNPPIGAQDRYTHWPPLLPILLAICFRLCGTSEFTAHILMLGILLSTAFLLLRLGWLWLGPTGGALTAYFWLTLPVTVQMGDLIAQEALAMLFVVAATLAFYSHYERIGCLLVFLGVLSSWESALLVVGVWALVPKIPELRRSASLATLGAGSALLTVAAIFLAGSPLLALDALQTVKFYAGLSSVYSNVLPHDREQLNLAKQLSGILWNHLWMLGALGLAAIASLLTSRPKMAALPIAALSAPWILWTLVMRTHVAVHDFELMIAAPLAALALAWLATADLRISPSGIAILKIGVICALAAVQCAILPGLRLTLRSDYGPERLIRFGRDIRVSTEPNAIVMAPLDSAVPIYYSERHIVRGIDSQASLFTAITKARQEFPLSEVYLAVPPYLAGHFADALSKSTVVSSSPDTIVAKLNLAQIMINHV